MGRSEITFVGGGNVPAHLTMVEKIGGCGVA